MKKSILALMMALVLSLSLVSGAMATATGFQFTAQEYVTAYTEFCSLALQKEITWSEDVEAEDMVGRLGSTDGMNDLIVYNMVGDDACVAVYADITIGISDSDMTAKAQALGMTVAAIPYATRYLECGNDLVAMSEEIEVIEKDCTDLVQTVFSSDAITSAMSEPYTATAVIGGHNAQLTLEVDMDTMAMIVTFIYMN